MMEGSGASKFVQVIRKYGYNKDVEFELATVISPPPAIKIRVDRMKEDLDASDLIIAESLTEHTRVVSVNDGSVNISNATMTIQSPLNAGDRVIVASINNGQTYIVLDKAEVF